MWYPQKGSIANGSRRSWPTAPAAAAVVSEAIVAPTKTPCSHERASYTSGTVAARRPPKRIAEIGTPRGSSHSGAIDGHCAAGTVKRALGGAGGRRLWGVQCEPSQSISSGGGSGVMPSHHA